MRRLFLFVAVTLLLVCLCRIGRAQDSSPSKVNAISAQSFATGVQSQAPYIAELEAKVKALQSEVDRLTLENKSLKESQ